MSLDLQTRFIELLSIRLDNFRKESATHYYASCPYCGDIHKSTKKKGRRFSIYTLDHQNYWTNCFKCQTAVHMEKLLQDLFPDLYDDYKQELFKENPRNKRRRIEEDITPASAANDSSLNSIMKILRPLADMPTGDNIVKYAKQRLIPDDRLDDIYSLIDGFPSLNLNDKIKKKLFPLNNRMIFPFYNKFGRIVGISGRDINKNSKLRYYTLKFDKKSPLIYGIDKLNENKKFYITEGPIDSLFIKNSIAAGGSALARVSNFVKIENGVFVFDNTPRAKEIQSIMESTINKKYKVVIWPSSFKHKDINDAILAGVTNIQEIIDENTYQGLEANVAYNKWRT